MTEKKLTRKQARRKQLRAAIYVRVSTQEQVKENYDSIDSQIDSCQKYAAQHGYQVIHVLKDPGASGTHTNRPGYQRLLRAIREDEVDVVLVFMIERLNRNIEDGTALLSIIRKQKVSLMSVTESIDLSNPGGRLNALMLMAFNEYYAEDVKHKQSIKYRNARDRGCFIGGTPPFGYSRNKDVITPVPEEAKIVKDIFSWYLNGELPTAIAKLSKHALELSSRAKA